MLGRPHAGGEMWSVWRLGKGLARCPGPCEGWGSAGMEKSWVFCWASWGFPARHWGCLWRGTPEPYVFEVGLRPSCCPPLPWAPTEVSCSLSHPNPSSLNPSSEALFSLHFLAPLPLPLLPFLGRFFSSSQPGGRGGLSPQPRTILSLPNVGWPRPGLHSHTRLPASVSSLCLMGVSNPHFPNEFLPRPLAPRLPSQDCLLHQS